MRFFVALDGVDALERLAATAESELERDLERAAHEAAKDGIEEAQAHHRYQDRTHHLTATAGAVDDGSGESEMTWPMPYASYVDRTRFNFTRGAETRATRSLDIRANTAAKGFVRKVSR
jgi:hypothetical protein